MWPEGPTLSLTHHVTHQSYAVLAILSDCYPPLKGRLSIRYSPFRRFYRTSPAIARLACNRHTATVRSEPGSNPLKFFIPLRLLSSYVRLLVQNFSSGLLASLTESHKIPTWLSKIFKLALVFSRSSLYLLFWFLSLLFITYVTINFDHWGWFSYCACTIPYFSFLSIFFFIFLKIFMITVKSAFFQSRCFFRLTSIEISINIHIGCISTKMLVF